MNRTLVPYDGGIADYASGPEHQFFLWDTAAAALDPSSVPDPASAPGVQLRPETAADRIRPEHGGSPYGGQTTPGSPGLHERHTDTYRRGQADLSFGNIARAGAMMGSVIGPLGPIKMGVSLARNPSPYTGYMGPTRAGQAIIDAGGSAQEAFAADRAARDKAIDAGLSHQQRERESYSDSGGGGGGGRSTSGGAPQGGQSGGPRGYADGGIAGRRFRVPDAGPASDPTFLDRIRAQRRPAPPRRRGIGPTDGPMPPHAMAAGGIVDSPTPGRSDQIDTEAEDGTYVVPADIVSAIGEGNTAAGAQILDRGVQGLLRGQTNSLPMKRGGRVPVRVSGGEYAIPPAAVIAHGAGSHKRGADRLDKLVAEIRKRTAKKLRQLPGPRR